MGRAAGSAGHRRGRREKGEAVRQGKEWARNWAMEKAGKHLGKRGGTSTRAGLLQRWSVWARRRMTRRSEVGKGRSEIF